MGILKTNNIYSNYAFIDISKLLETWLDLNTYIKVMHYKRLKLYECVNLSIITSYFSTYLISLLRIGLTRTKIKYSYVW